MHKYNYFQRDIKEYGNLLLQSYICFHQIKSYDKDDMPYLFFAFTIVRIKTKPIKKKTPMATTL